MTIIITVLIILLLLSVVFLVMIKPNNKRDYSRFTAKSFAHRGLFDDSVPENSMKAFRLAKEAGYGVELDVQYTKDEKIVVFHDASLKRMCGIDGLVKDYTFEELQAFPLKGTEERIPLFEDVLKVLDKVPLVCEIKNSNGNRNDKLCSETYDYLKTYPGDFCIESFSPFLVQWFRNNHPEIIRGQLSCKMEEDSGLSPLNRFLMTHLLVNFFSRPDFLAYCHYDMNCFGFKLCKAVFSPLIIAWTARGDAEIKSAWTKADSVIFEKNPPKDNIK